MEIWGWLAENSFDLLGAVGIISGLWFTAISYHVDTKTRRVTNLLTLTVNHREIWKEFAHNPEVARVLDAQANLTKQPITAPEARFVNMVIMHITAMYYSTQNDFMIKQVGLRRDVVEFLSLPIPKAVWENIKMLQNDDFVAFIESCRNWK